MLKYLIVLIGGLIAAVFYEKSQKDTANSLLGNTETKEKLLVNDKVINENQVKIDDELQKQEELKKSLTGVKDVSIEDLQAYLNKPTNSK